MKSTSTQDPDRSKLAQAPAGGARHSVRVADFEERTATLGLDEHGVIHHCNRAGEALFKYRRGELLSQHVSVLLPQLADMDLLHGGQPSPRLRFLCRIGHHFQVQDKDGERFASDIFLNVLDSHRLSLIVRPASEASG